MRLARLELKDIGPFEDAVFEIPEPTKGTGELVLFEGPNGCGKTTVLQAIAVMLTGGEAPFGVSLEDAVKPGKNMPWLHTKPPVHDLVRRLRGGSSTAVVNVIHGAHAVGLELRTLQKANHVEHEVLRSPGTHQNVAIANLARFSRWAEYVEPIDWAAFAFQAHHRTADLATPGPRDIHVGPLEGALSFGRQNPGSSLLGQFLVNLENDRTKAMVYASERADERKKHELADVAQSRKEAISRFEKVFSKVLNRRTEIEFSVGQQEPALYFDSEAVPLDLLGEGLRSTLSWLSDLLVRVERVRWADTSRSSIDQEFWLILDEIEESLHPTMQAHIYPALRELFPNARIYATTHSPFVVASVGEGTVFPIRPDKDHKVRGKIEARALEPGLSLEWVTSEIFQAQTGFIDAKVQGLLADHKRAIRRFERMGTVDWEEFFKRRAELMKLNDEVRVVVAMQETPMRAEIDRRMLARSESSEQGAST